LESKGEEGVQKEAWARARGRKEEVVVVVEQRGGKELAVLTVKERVRKEKAKAKETP
jgi:hypothetical protein